VRSILATRPLLFETMRPNRNQHNLISESPTSRRFASTAAQPPRPIFDFVITGEWPQVRMAKREPMIIRQPSLRDTLIARRSETIAAFRAVPPEIAILGAPGEQLDLVSDWIAAQCTVSLRSIDARASDTR